MADDLLALAADLGRRQEPFALATVVRCERPTSAKPGAKAIVRSDGSLVGWVGGACAEPVVIREALLALRDGQPRLVALVGEGRSVPGRAEGVIPYPMSCHSGGTLEVYVEPYLPRPLLLLIGHGPVMDALDALARAAGFSVSLVPPGSAAAALERLLPGPGAGVVVATHGDADEDALDGVLRTQAGYVSLIASRKRAAAVMENLARRGVPLDRVGRLKAPAGLDLGAVTPEEIAVSILAEIVQFRRSAKPGSAGIEPAEPSPGAEASGEITDPVCGMLVSIGPGAHRALAAGRTFYFCCAGCRERFEREPRRYAPDLAG